MCRAVNVIATCNNTLTFRTPHRPLDAVLADLTRSIYSLYAFDLWGWRPAAEHGADT